MDSSFSEVEFDKQRMSSKLNENQRKKVVNCLSLRGRLLTRGALVNEDIHMNDLVNNDEETKL